MKIALIHMRHANTGGTELFLNHLSRYLAEQGEEVTIICRTHVESSHSNIKFVKLAGLAIGKSHRIWKFAKDVENHLKSHHYDFVYGLGKTWSHDMLRIGGGTRMHLVDTIRDGKPNLKDKVAIEIEQRSMKDGAYRHIVANSYKSAHEIQQAYNVQPEKISVIHNFVDTKQFDRERVSVDVEAFRNSLSIDWSKPVFLFLGTGYRRKGLSEALQAFSQLSIEANLLIVGRESHEENYKQQAQSLKITEKCHFLGSQTTPELFFSLVDCYVFPTHYEPFGFTAIEALSCGCPVITTEDCGAKEVMQPSVSTVVESGKNINALTEAMHYWAAKRNDLNLKKACRDLALTLDVEAMMEKNYQMILSIYKEKQK